MKGLLYKEFYTLRPQIKGWLTMLIIFIAYAIVFKNSFMILIMLAMVGFTSCFNSFHYDKQYQCNEFIAAMPVSRGQMVAAKYLFAFSIDLVMALVSAVVILLMAAFSKLPSSLSEAAITVSSILGVTIIMQCVVIPMIYILGVEKARYANIVIWLLPSAIIFLNKDRLPAITESMVMGAMKLLPLIVIALIVISWGISTVVFRRKDL